MVYHANSAKGLLVLDSCNINESSATMAVTSPYSDAEIRNAIVDGLTFRNVVAGTCKDLLTLVDRAVKCIDSKACRTAERLDGMLGVLCECLESGNCLNDGGVLSLSLKTGRNKVIYNLDPVSCETLVTSAASATTR